MPLVVFLVLVALVAKFFWWLVAVAVTVVVARLLGGWWVRCDARDAARWAREEELRARADREHRLVMAGDERGVYGQFPPCV